MQTRQASTRVLIDDQLRAAGWIVDSALLRHAAGARPEYGKAMAIAEWPTATGPVDYALFIDGRCIGVVEAKREVRDVPGRLGQAKRYATGIALTPDELPDDGPWLNGADRFRVPFLFVTNGRPYVKQLATKSGIWFWDARPHAGEPRALPEWFSPRDLVERLEQETEDTDTLAEREIGVTGLRPYQQDAIAAVEKAVGDGQRHILLAMATGTGKTRLAIALMYELLRRKRFRRILFLVDRNALGRQTLDAMSTTDTSGFLKFDQVFPVADLVKKFPEATDRVQVATVQVATVQAMIRRVFDDSDGERPTPGTYDLIIVDEAHRGYTLDAELREDDLGFRNLDDYLSTYRRVLDFFDATKVALTATPALHTREIFGPPVYHYSYRQAVIDGYLIDHRPPRRITTALSQTGIHFDKDEEVSILDPRTGALDLFNLDDEVDFEVAQFNKKVYRRACPDVSFHHFLYGEAANCIRSGSTNFGGHSRSLVTRPVVAHFGRQTKSHDEGGGQSSGVYEPIAIVGIGCRFPGGITSPTSFWELLCGGEDGTSEVPESRWSLDRHYDPERGKPGKLYTRRGGFIHDVKGFDPQFFGISPREAASMDPQQRLLLETTWEAFEDAGIPPAGLARQKVGVFIGLFTHDYENLHMRTSERHLQSPHSATGMSTTISANRLSYAFDFMGPSMVIDTACSSSLVAVHLAARTLQSGEAEIAVAGGVNLQLAPEMTMALCNASMLSPDGRSMSFDARANGYARADGAGVVVLKPLDKARRDGDAIYAVIAGSAVNQDGHTSGISVPNGIAQQSVMRDALAAAGITGADITYVEAHGTGTPVGDPIEAKALGGVLSADQPERSPCVIGSVKSNFGHAESAAGVAGLIKVALMQAHGRIPANLHFETPNPDIPFHSLRVRVPTAAEEWPAAADRTRYAGVNSFGFGGTNAHVVVARAPEPGAPAAAPQRPHGASVLPLSARSKNALIQSAAQLEAFLRSAGAADLDLAEIAAALSLGRSHLDERMVVTARSHAAAADLLASFCKGDRPVGVVVGTVAGTQRPLVFACSGMGQQWWGMGRELLGSEPVFAAKVAEIDALFGRLGNDYPLADLFAADEQVSPIDRTQFAQRAIFAVQVGLAALWEDAGIRPDFVVGHSVGELAAAHIAGALTLEDAVTIAFHRSRLQAQLAGCGGMLAVGLSEAEIRPYLAGIADQVSLAAVNSPGSVTLAGDTEALQGLCAGFEAEQIFVRMLNVEVPYHSPAMDRITPEFRRALQGISPVAARIPLVSTVTGAVIEGASLDGDYWVRNVREPVFFRNAMQVLADAGCATFVELGAHPVLATSIDECLAADGVKGAVIASQRRKQDGAIGFWSAYGQLHCGGFEMPFARLHRRNGKRIDLPTYPWQRTQFWSESAESRRDRTGRETDDGPLAHPLLGDRQSAPQPVWRAGIGPARPSYLNEHRVQDAVVFPGAGFVEAALAACRESGGAGGTIMLEGFRIEAPLVLSEGQAVNLQTSLGEAGKFEIHSQTGRPGEQHWSRHVTGTAARVPDQKPLAPFDWQAMQARLPQTEDAAAFYARFDSLGLGYGPRFRNIARVWVGKDEILGQFRAPARAAEESDGAAYILHPALLDAAFQLLAGLPEKGTYLPVGIDRITVFKPGEPFAWANVTLTQRSRSRIKANIAIANADGAIIALVDGFACQLFENADLGVRAAEEDFLYGDGWVEEPLSTSPAHRVLAANVPDFEGLHEDLQARHTARDNQRVHQRAVQEIWPRLDSLALEYFAEALVELGWVWEEGQHITLGDLMHALGIAPRHRNFVSRMFALLEMTGAVRREDGGWRVIQAPACGGAAGRWRELAGEYPHCHAELVLTQRSGAGLARFLTGEDDILFALFPKGCPIAEQFYADGPILKPYNRVVADLIHQIVAHLPEGRSLRILEVGSGTGSLAAHLLPLLPPERTEYVFTDLSERFLGQARQRFGNHGFVRYEKLDLETDLAGQGFTANSFDLVLGGDVIHATSDLVASLTKVRSLLKPGGMMALIELTATPAWIDLIFGLLPGWWAFTDTDLRPDHATLPVGGWLHAFNLAGFDAGGAIVDEFSERAGPHSVLLARKPVGTGASEVFVHALAASTGPIGQGRAVIVLGDEASIVDPLSAHLTSLGAQVHVAAGGTHALQDALLQLHAASAQGSAQETPVVVDMRNVCRAAAIDAGTTPSQAAAQRCEELQASLMTLSGMRDHGRHTLWVVTNGTQRIGDASAGPDLAAATLWGFARTAVNELDDVELRLADLSQAPDPDEVAALAQEILADGRDPEVALRKTRRHVSRVHRWRKLRAADAAETVYEVRRSSRAAPADLSFHEASAPPPGAGEVQLRIKASGINFKDFAILGGLVSSETGDIGFEASGTILATGPQVTGFAPGDEVFGLVLNGMNAVVNVPATALVRKPGNLTFEDAAGIPVAFLSAYHALKQQARLQPGQTVLIHTAASGLGLAAIAVAQALGARVLATAGTPEKRAYLNARGIVFAGDSRSAGFADEVMEHTGGAGVDVVLNTLPAALNDHNFRILKRRTGCLIDVANVHYDSQLAYGALVRGVSVSAFDLMVIAQDDFGYVQELLEELAAMFASGQLRPIPYRSVSIERLSEVLHSVGEASHIGKLIVSHADSRLNVMPGSGHMRLAGDGCYLITGGLTGFGLATAKWFAHCGARHLVLVGRRGADTPEAAAALAELRAAKVTVHALACDVSDRGQLAALTERFGRDLPPLRGIVHGAMVLRDGPIRTMQRDDIRSVMAPKLDGAWYLHQLTEGHPLDFFVCHSSISSLVGNRDQANYAAANAYLEALMALRRSRGRPGLAIGWGMIGEAGAVARDQDKIDVFLRQGVYPLTLEQAWASLTLALHDGLAYLGAAVVDWRKLGKFARVIANTPRFRLVAQASAAAARGAASREAPGDHRAGENGPEDTTSLVVREVAGVLGLTPDAVDLDRPLPELGFDSLMAVELSIALELATGHGFSRMSLLRSDLTAADLVAAVGGAVPDDGDVIGLAPTAAPDQPKAVDVADLSDAEVEALLRELSAGQ